MAATLGSNISALRSVRLLDQSSSTLRKVFERLSSGARINRAADDAAGLAVSMSLSTRARILDRSDKNLQDGISAVNIADGAFDQVSNTLGRMAELAAQAANGSLSRFQRMSLHQEFRGLSDEIRRISETTTFNGINLVGGSRVRSKGTELQQPDTAGSYTAVATSADGRYALTTDDFYALVYDRQTNAYTQLGTINSGTPQAAMDSLGNAYFADGQNLYRFDIQTRQVTQLTNSSTGTNYNGLTVSADGTRLAFSSTTQFGDGNTLATSVSTTGSNRIYAVDLSTSAYTVRRVAQAAVPVIGGMLSLSSDGTKIHFASNSNLVSQNSDLNWELYGADLTGTSFDIKQVTNTTGVGGIALTGGQFKSLNDGRVIFLDTRNYSGQNPSGYRQLFTGSLNGAAIQQFGNVNLSQIPGAFTLSADESSVFFISNSNVTGLNSAGNYQSFRVDLGNGVASQLTDWVDTPNEDPTDGAFSGDGRTLYGVVFGINTGQAGYRLIDLSATESTIDISTGNGRQGGIGVAFSALRSVLEGIGGYTLTSAASARGALDSVQTTIQNLAAARGKLGAGSARLEAALKVVQAQVQESRAANARIVDADIASESALLVRTQILQQAGSAVLAQANQQPALVLSLLRV